MPALAFALADVFLEEVMSFDPGTLTGGQLHAPATQSSAGNECGLCLRSRRPLRPWSLRVSRAKAPPCCSGGAGSREPNHAEAHIEVHWPNRSIAPQSSGCGGNVPKILISLSKRKTLSNSRLHAPLEERFADER